jgi:hypothetical protein
MRSSPPTCKTLLEFRAQHKGLTYGRLNTAFHLVTNDFHMFPAPPRSGIWIRAGLRNVVQNLVQLRAERTPNLPLLSSLIH